MSAEAPLAPAPPRPRPAAAAAGPSWRGQLVAVLAGAAVGASGTLLTLRFVGPALREPPLRDALRSFEGWGLLAAAVLVVLAWLVVVAVHELGHVLGGVVARFRFFFVIVGPLSVERDLFTGVVRVKANTSVSRAGGMAASFPTDARDLRRRFCWFVLGGPLASLLFGLALFAVAASVPEHESPYAWLVLGFVGVMSLLIFVVTIIPTSQGAVVTDGARLLQLARGELGAVAAMPLLGLVTAGVPPREWPRELVERALQARENTPEECQANLLAYSYHLDAGDVQRAGARLDRALALRDVVDRVMIPALLVEAAYVDARHRGRPGPARETLAQVPRSAVGVNANDMLRVEAAIALAEGNRAEARRLAREALDATPARDAFSRAQLEGLLRDSVG